MKETLELNAVHCNILVCADYMMRETLDRHIKTIIVAQREKH